MFRMNNQRKKHKIDEENFVSYSSSSSTSNTIEREREEDNDFKIYWENKMSLLMNKFEKMNLRQNKMEEELTNRDYIEKLEKKINKILNFVEEVERKQTMKIEELEKENDELKFQMGIMRQEEEEKNKLNKNKKEYDFYN